MAEITPRLPCPVCLGVILERTGVGESSALQVDHCRRCGGVWLEYDEVQQLRREPPRALWSAVAKRQSRFRMPCHSCHAPFGRDADRCPSCGWKNVLDCPLCAAPMRRESRDGVHLDVCRTCKGAWFDQHELAASWSLHAATALARRPATTRLAGGGMDAGDVLLDVLWYSPDLAFYGAQAAGHAITGAARAATRLPDAAAAAPEASVGLVQAAGEAAGSVFEVVVGILEGLFSAIDF